MLVYQRVNLYLHTMAFAGWGGKFPTLCISNHYGQVQLDDGRVSLDSNSHFGPTERGFDRFDGGNRRMKKMKMDEGPLKKMLFIV